MAGRVRRLARRVPRLALVDAPAVVLEPGRAALGVVELLPRVLPDVADVQVAGLTVEREAPRVPEPVADDERLRTLAPDVELQQLAEGRPQVLRPVLGIAAGAAVAGPGVEVAVRPEDEVPAVVVFVRIVLEEDLAQLPRPARQPARLVLDDPRVAVAVGVVDVEVPVLRVLRAEREPEESLLAVVEDERADVEERTGAQPSADDDAHPADLLGDVDVVRLVPRSRHRDRLREAARDADDAQLAPLRAAAGAQRDNGRERGERNDD